MDELVGDKSLEQRVVLKTNLQDSGFKIIWDNKSILIEMIKNIIITMIHYSVELSFVNYSDFISGKLGFVHAYIAIIFTGVKGINIQRFTINHNKERVKELRIHDKLNLREFFSKLHHINMTHLSNPTSSKKNHRIDTLFF